ncbi:polysaccharide biosynthesis/export family protein [Dyella sp.]|jgi:polysaccharide export outer membrane protein|uniref:polysaccharide biosynthesis/export family protein n=1 Tax=Dyella sp. TaxID=1869338 RepID=UPI002D77570F|nr:polysaccharide biosynthesis/export family protein [Dyella sp.]HET6431600.1 polysaccharide biosynthesis/export family protein [Dyella sp.]
MKSFSLVGLMLSALLLHGCAIAPGQRMSADALTHGDAPESGHVQLVQITPDLVSSPATDSRGEAVPAALTEYQPKAYQIGPGDTLYITIWDHPELTSPAGSQQQTLPNGRLIRPDGTLFYPYVGTIKAEGMTVEELRQVISKKIAAYVDDPQVDVSVIGYGSQRITLEGAFGKTDPQAITAVPMTLGQVVGTAGVDAEQADLSDLVLTRDGQDYHLDLNAVGPRSAQGIYLKPGDRLFLPYNDQREVYVMGEVIRPQAIPFKTSSLTLTQVIGRAGGLNPVTSDGRAVYVIRGVQDLAREPAKVYHLNARSPAAFALADNFQVHAGDVVFVGPAGVTRWNRVLSQLLPLSGIVGNAALTNQRLGN